MLHIEELGSPLPFDDHATSASLPDWADVVDYEEGRPRVTSVMKIGYPRFKIHSSVEELANFMLDKRSFPRTDHAAYVFPTRHVAKRFLLFMIQVTN